MLKKILNMGTLLSILLISGATFADSASNAQLWLEAQELPSCGVSLMSQYISCAPSEKIYAHLKNTRNEDLKTTALVFDKQIIEVYANKESKKWSVLSTTPDKMSCLLDYGNSYHEEVSTLASHHSGLSINPEGDSGGGISLISNINGQWNLVKYNHEVGACSLKKGDNLIQSHQPEGELL